MEMVKLKESGGVADIAEQIINACNSYVMENKLVYDKNPKELVRKLMSRLLKSNQ